MNYREKECFPIIKLPETITDEDRGKSCSSCCSNQMVLADDTSNKTYKNDVTGVYLKKGLAADVISFTMENCSGVVVSNQGEVGLFPRDTLAVGYIFDWKQILSAHGVGTYKIKVDYVIAGIVGGHTIRILELKKFSIPTARDSVRIYSEFNSFNQLDGIDFTDSNFKDSVRFNGKFGYREPETDINNLIDTGKIIVKATRENVNKYTLNTDPLEIGMTKQLIDFHFLNEDGMKISDHNRFNHDFQIFDKEVSLKEGAKIEYIEDDRRANISVIFGDRKLQDKSYFR